MRQALELALEALTYIYTETTADEDELIDKAITAIKEALAQPEQEPVASIFISGIGEREFDDWEHDLPVGRNLLYTTPPQRKPLTELEAENLFDNCGGKWNGDHWVIKDADLHDFARAIEAAHGIKE